MVAANASVLEAVREQILTAGHRDRQDQPAPRMDAFSDWFVRACSKPDTMPGMSAAVARDEVL